MHKACLLVPAILINTMFCAAASRAQYGGQQNYPQQTYPQQNYPQQGRVDWDTPPGEYNDDFHRRAFRDGIEAARQDAQNGRRLDPDERDEFRHPHVPDQTRDDYREAYKRGYFLAVEHLRAGGQQVAPPPPPRVEYERRDWDTAPAEYVDELRQQAFRDGIQAARQDVQNRAQLDPTRTSQFHHPPVPKRARDTYRDAFQHGTSQPSSTCRAITTGTVATIATATAAKIVRTR